MKKTLAVLSILTLLTACGPTNKPAYFGPNSVDVVAFHPTPNASRIYLTLGQLHRHTVLGDQVSPDYHVAEVTIDGQKVAEISMKEYVAFDIKAGKHEISWMQYDVSESTMTPHKLQMIATNNTIKILQLEYFDDRSEGAQVLGSMGALGVIAAGIGAKAHTEILIADTTDILNDRTLIYYKKL